MPPKKTFKGTGAQNEQNKHPESIYTHVEEVDEDRNPTASNAGPQDAVEDTTEKALANELKRDLQRHEADQRQVALMLNASHVDCSHVLPYLPSLTPHVLNTEGALCDCSR